MGILLNEESRILVQGITGREGSFHARAGIAYGTNVVAGVTPGRGGQLFDDTVPVFDAVADAVAATGANVSLIFVPAALCSRCYRRGRRCRSPPDCLHYRGRADAGYGPGVPLSGAKAGGAG